MDAGWLDTEKYPNIPRKYTYWDQKLKLEEENEGLEDEYFLIPSRELKRIISIEIRPDIKGSIHCHVIWNYGYVNIKHI